MNRLYLIFPEKRGTIAPEIYGHFAEHIGGVIYDGIYVGKDSQVPNIKGFRKSMIDQLKKINIPVLRWPGGCYAETYDWRDGIGSERPTRINWWTHRDSRYESNEVGLHEFMEFTRLIGTKPYYAVNLTSTTPLEVQHLVDYCESPAGVTTLAKEREQNGDQEPFGIKYWGIGNENWGGGGNMEPEIYAHEYRKYSALVDNVPGDKVLIACGPNGDDYHWTEEFMKVMAKSEKHMSGYSLHYYCGSAGDPVNFTKAEWYQQLRQALYMEEVILRHWNIIAGYGMEQYSKLVIDEWGCWHPDGSGPSKGFNLFEQQSTMRDAMVTALTLNLFNRHCDKIRMANVAQLVNNLHALFLSGGEHCIVTPTYHVFDLYQEHMGAEAVSTVFQTEPTICYEENGKEMRMNQLSVSASRKEDWVLITAANLSADETAAFYLEGVGEALKSEGELKILAEEDYHAHNTFEQPDRVQVQEKKVNLTEPVIIPKAGIISLRVQISK